MLIPVPQMVKWQSAFTLVELLVTLTIVTILGCLAVPSFQSLLLKTQRNALVSRVVSAVIVARRSAIEQGERVVFCGSSDGEHCDGRWSRGQLIRLADGETMRQYGGLPTQWRLLWRSNFAKNTTLELLPSGFTNGQQGSFYLCSSTKVSRSDSLDTVITVSLTGQVRVAQQPSRAQKVC